jgi:hypothetical protein
MNHNDHLKIFVRFQKPENIVNGIMSASSFKKTTQRLNSMRQNAIPSMSYPPFQGRDGNGSPEAVRLYPFEENRHRRPFFA